MNIFENFSVGSPILMHGDCLDMMKSIPSGSIDMILCDLPYGTTRNKWDAVIPFEPLWVQYKRIIKRDGAIVLNSAQPFTSFLILSNISDFKYCWYWKKNRATGVLNAKKQPLRNIEEVVVFNVKQYVPQGLIPYNRPSRNGSRESDNYNKGKTNSYIREWTNYPLQLLEFDSVQRVQHPTEKPVALCEYLIKTYTNKGETVLDNCMGSGTTGVACKNLGRKFIGIEKDEKYFEIAKQRILK